LHYTHISEAKVILRGTPESLELAIGIESGDLSCTHVTIIESHIHIPYYHMTMKRFLLE